MAGYSGTPLYKKLGIKDGFVVSVVNAPFDYSSITKEAQSVRLHNKLTPNSNLVHFFTTRKEELEKEFPKLRQSIIPNGMIWISWPKTTRHSGKSKTQPESAGDPGQSQDDKLNENIIQDIGLKNRMVDVKVAAIDETWSGLKFVIRLKDRD